MKWIKIKVDDVRERGIGKSPAADLRRRLATFTEDWDRPEMAAYDVMTVYTYDEDAQ